MSRVIRPVIAADSSAGISIGGSVGEVPFYPLGELISAVESLGLEVTYAYEDLVFISHNAYLVRFADTGGSLNVYVNTEAESGGIDELIEDLKTACEKYGLKAVFSGSFTAEQTEEEQIALKFFENGS